MRGGVRGFLAVTLTAASLVPVVVGVATAPPAAAAAPAPTPARTGAPADIYAIGDSITTATGTGNLGAEQPANSWVTGTNGTVQSMRHRLGISASNAVNLASNGRRMQDFDDQADRLPASAQYVVVELGGNDLCRPSVGEMTSAAAYRAEFAAGLRAVAAHAPDALVFVASIPDIYNLWYLRGAPSSVNPQVADQTGQEGQARLYWDNPLIDVIPCQSLLASPTSTSSGDEGRRQQVRARNLAFNQILEEECGAVLRCRYDGDAFFDRSSNRVSPPDGALLARDQWWFQDDDISHNDGFWAFLCPAPGILEGGTVCGDHFHPSLSGQAKLALGGHQASYQFQADATAPTVTTSAARPADGDGVYARSVQVSFGGTDANGLRGQEVRIHRPDGTVGGWQPHLGVAPPITVSATGTTYVEARSLDVNGNLSASTVRAVTVDPGQFGTVAGTVTGPSGPLGGIEVSLHATGAEGALRTATTGVDGTYSFADVVASGDVKVRAHDPSGVHVDQWFGGAPTHAAATTVDVPGGGTATRDLALALTPGTLAGTVTGPGGGLAGIQVDLHGTSSEGVLASTTTDGDGHFAFAARTPGSYKVQFTDPSGDHLGEWHADAATHAAAAAVTVVTSATTTVDAVLAVTPGSITGTVSGPDGPIEGIEVVARPRDTPETAGVSVFTGADGGYEITGLAPGPHSVSTPPVPCAWLGTATDVEVPTAGRSATVDPIVAEEPPGPHGLTGVPAWIDDAVRWLVDDCNDPPYMTGLPDGSFGAAPAISRGQALRAIWRIAGRPDEAAPHGLGDVPAWIEPAVRWAVAHRYLTGFPDGSFRADAPVSRGQIARLLFRLAGEPAGPPYGPHGLGDVGTWIEPAVRWMVAEGHATGIDGSFRQDAPISRAQFARMAFRIYA